MYRFILLLTIAALGTLPSLGANKESRREKEKVEKLSKYADRQRKVASDSYQTQERRFLEARAEELLHRAVLKPAGSYVLDRELDAIDSLLDACEDIGEVEDALQKARSTNSDDDDEERREDAARHLERVYFRVKQGDYFSRQSKERLGAQYVSTAQRLYHLARAQYDASHYRAARKLADAAHEVINALESLAQASVRIPEPPRM